jgi:excisionase family DNA binding protein
VGSGEKVVMDDRWRSRAEIAVCFGVSKDSVYRWLEQSQIPAHKVGRQWKFKAAEVDSWFRSGKADFAPSADATKATRPARTRKGR